MSLINQMLQDLERRRASGNERGTLPSQVRVLPPAQRHHMHWWLLGLGAAAALVAVLAWQLNYPPVPLPAQAASTSAPAAGVSPTSSPTLPLPPPAALPAQDPPGAPLSEAPPTLASAASKPAPDLEKTPAAESEPSNSTAREAAPKTAKSPEKTPREAAAARDVPIKPQPPLATSSVTAAEPKAEVSKVASANTETVTVMKAVAPTAPQPAAPTVSAKSEPPAAAVPAPQAAPGAKQTVTPPSTARPPDDAKMRAVLANPQIDKRSQQLTAQQLAENEYRDGANLLNQGRLAQAQEGFRLALQHYPAHIGARQGLFGVLLEAKKNGEAEQVLQDGLKLNPNQPGFAMALARLQVDRGDTVGAVETLQKTAPSALHSPDYLAFLAALLQRQSRHQEAIDHYQAALRLAPQSGVWLMGLGISLQALNRNNEAQDMFRRAKSTNTLNPELQAFVDQRIRQLQ